MSVSLFLKMKYRCQNAKSQVFLPDKQKLASYAKYSTWQIYNQGSKIEKSD